MTRVYSRNTTGGPIDTYGREQTEQNQLYNSYGGYQQKKNNIPFGDSKKSRRRKLTQKITEVISLCKIDNQQGNNQFDQVINAERGIYDLLTPYQESQLLSGPGASQTYIFGENQTQKRYPFQQLGETITPTIRQYLSRNEKIPLSDDAIEMIASIEKKALAEIESLKKEKEQLLRLLNRQIQLHQEEKQRRIWLERQLLRVINDLKQQGINIYPNHQGIPYPQHVFESRMEQSQRSPTRENIKLRNNRGNSYPVNENRYPNYGNSYPIENNILQANYHREEPQYYQAQQNYLKGPKEHYLKNQRRDRITSNQQYTRSPRGTNNQSQFYQRQQRQMYPTRINQQERPISPLHHGQKSLNKRSYKQQDPYQPQTFQKESYSNRISYNDPYRAHSIHNTNQNIQYPQSKNNNNYNLKIKPPKRGTNISYPRNEVQERMHAAQQNAKMYQKTIQNYKTHKDGNKMIPGLLELLQQCQRIRVQTIRLMKLKQSNSNQGNNQQLQNRIQQLQQQLEDEEANKFSFLNDLKEFKQKYKRLEQQNNRLKSNMNIPDQNSKKLLRQKSTQKVGEYYSMIQEKKRIKQR